MESANLYTVDSEETLGTLLEKSKQGLVVLHFWADWAPQCEQMNDVMLELKKEPALNSVIFSKIMAEDLPEISLRYEIQAVPTFVLIQNNKMVSTIKGANTGELSDQVRQRAGAMPFTPAPSQAPPAQSEEDRYKSLINRAPVMLFMKGNPQEPKCGFSKRIVKILQDERVVFSTFDILLDEGVRQGLKKYSNWPTFPQVYLNGELMGGLDIIEEMVENGEIKETFPIAEDVNKKIEKIIQSAEIMLFMKGDRNLQKCGFSKKAVAILNSKNVSYSTFDILEDNDVRQGLKEYSNWPTYPQLYVKKGFVGGIDIIQELEEAGELGEVLANGPEC